MTQLRSRHSRPSARTLGFSRGLGSATLFHDLPRRHAASPPRAAGLRASGVARAFTLVELLVVVSIIAVLVTLVTVAAGAVRGAGSAAKELALGRSLMTAFVAYATDNRGTLMPGYYNVQPPLGSVTDAQGNPITGQGAYRYPWRLAPYLDYNLAGLVQDKWLLDDLHYTNQFNYFVSLYPSLGMNSAFIGGDSSAEGMGFDPVYEQQYGRFYMTRLAQPKRPADLIVFGSARTNAPYEPGAPPVIEGYFRIESPYMLDRRWDLSWNPDAPPKQWGFVSMRLKPRKAAFAFLDGHTGYLDDGEVQDMRRWCDLATRPDWKLGE
ncbi:MAG: type II secretion system protein [Phycisphaerales bacterium]